MKKNYMVKRKIIQSALLLILALTLLFYKNSFAAEDKILCVVGDELITQKDLNEYLSLASFELSSQYTDKKELEKRMAEIKKDALNQLIDEKMILQEAKRQKIKINEALISERIEQIRSQFPSYVDFSRALSAEGLNLNDVKKKLRDQLLIRATIEDSVRAKIFVHPKEVTDYFNEHKQEFVAPESAKVDSIFIAGESTSKIAQQKLQTVLQALKSGQDFLEVAKTHSDGPSLGQIRRGQLRKEIEEAIFKLNISEISQPIKTEKGYFIFKLLEIVPVQERELSDVQNEVYQVVFQDKFEAKFNEWLNTIKKDVYCVIK